MLSEPIGSEVTTIFFSTGLGGAAAVDDGAAEVDGAAVADGAAAAGVGVLTDRGTMESGDEAVVTGGCLGMTDTERGAGSGAAGTTATEMAEGFGAGDGAGEAVGAGEAEGVALEGVVAVETVGVGVGLGVEPSLAANFLSTSVFCMGTSLSSRIAKNIFASALYLRSLQVETASATMASCVVKRKGDKRCGVKGHDRPAGFLGGYHKQPVGV